jgi:hypothetical protein
MEEPVRSFKRTRFEPQSLGRFRLLSTQLSEDVRKRTRFTLPFTLYDDITNDHELSDIDHGNEIMDLMRANLAIIDEHWIRSRHQRTIHAYILVALCGFVYGKAFDLNELRIKEFNMIDLNAKLKSAVALTAPRRFGKTTAIAIICAVIFMSIPKCEISIVAQGTRAVSGSTGILSKIKEILRACFGFEKFEVFNSEHAFARFDDGDLRKINAYSGQAGNG